MQAFTPIISELFGSADFDVDQLSERFTAIMLEVSTRPEIPPLLSSFIYKAVVDRVDVQLVRELCAGQCPCTFIRSLAWNTFCSRVQDKADLVRFRDAVAVVQMTAVIVRNPACVHELCPHIDPQTVMAILSVRSLYDDVRTPPDIARFRACLKIQRGNKGCAFDADRLLDISGQFNDASLDEWRNVCIPGQILDDFPFLPDSFHEAQDEL